MRSIRRILTARDGIARLLEMDPGLGPPHGSGPGVWVQPSTRFQSIEGFGGAFTEAGAATWQQLGPAQREHLLQAYFDPSQGHGYSLCRVHMNSCDFALGHYAHADQPGDLELEHFSIERDRGALLPFIRAAQRVAGSPLKLLVSPWSPPAWMKSNGVMALGGRLLPQYRRTWARCFVRFIQAYAAEGVPVWGVTVQNEPEAAQRWDSCLYSAEEERDFVRDHLGPELERAGLSHVRVLIWDHNRDRMVERAAAVYADAEAARYVWGTAFHWYGEDHFDHVQQVHDAWPEKHLLFTEGCQEGGPHAGAWEVGERYARSMINDLNRWTEGWIDWNLLLDDSGGPNHVGNLCSAPMLADPQRDTLSPQSSYYYLGHFSRFVPPGSHRVLCASTAQDLEATAFVDTSGRTVVVTLNRTERALPFDLRVGTFAGATELPPRSIATYLLDEGPASAGNG